MKRRRKPAKSDVPANLGLLGDLRARVTALAPVREAAVSVLVLLLKGVLPHDAILRALGTALQLSRWTTTGAPPPKSALVQPPPAPPKAPTAPLAIQPATATICNCGHKRRRPRATSSGNDGRPRLTQLWFWPCQLEGA